MAVTSWTSTGRISLRPDSNRITMHRRIISTSTAGLHGAFTNWIAAAEQRGGIAEARRWTHDQAQKYFTVEATALTFPERVALAICCGDAPRKNDARSTSLSLRASTWVGSAKMMTGGCRSSRQRPVVPQHARSRRCLSGLHH